MSGPLSPERNAKPLWNTLQLEAAIRSISEGVCIFDAEKKLVICNERYASIYGLPPELTEPGASHDAIVKYRLDHGMQPIGTESFLSRHEELLRTNKPGVITVTLGNGRIISIHHHPMPDGGWVSTHHDITDEIARAKELELQHLLIKGALNNMRQGLCMFDHDRRLVVSNRRYAEMYNIAPDAVRPGMSLDEVFRQRFEAGNIPIEGPAVFLNKRLQVAAESGLATFDVEMTDGRVVSILHQPLDDGGWVATHEDVTEQRRNQARIQHLARHDPLTELPNRTLFQEHLGGIKARVQGGEILALFCVDLDHFKSVNDTLGHAMGDAVLKDAGQRLSESVREHDVVARIGGDEFAILAGRLGRPEEAARIAEQIVEKIAQPFYVDGHSAHIGASVGIAVAPVDGEDGEALMKCADMAMYRSKGAGRSTYHFYEKGLDAVLQDRRNTEAALRQALVKNEFRLVFQPLVNVVENRVCSFEALLRWRHPERGLLGPANFIPVAEDTGLIAPIGEWVLREACSTAANWPEQIGVAVNLSPVQFRKSRNLVEHVKSALSASGLKPARLELEITESVLLADDEAALLALNELRQLGVRIALDDFGVGYSSLSYLRRFHFDKIKIDRSFVRDSLENSESRAIVRAVIGLGRTLGMATTAEGVETEGQLDLVCAEGCTEVQGFLFSVPLPADAANEFASRLQLPSSRLAQRRAS